MPRCDRCVRNFVKTKLKINKNYSLSQKKIYDFHRKTFYNKNLIQRVPHKQYKSYTHLYLSTKFWNGIRIGQPICLILIVSNMPVYRSCERTHGMSNFIGDLSVLGLIQRTNHGLQRDIDSKSWCKLSENLWEKIVCIILILEYWFFLFLLVFTHLNICKNIQAEMYWKEYIAFYFQV